MSTTARWSLMNFYEKDLQFVISSKQSKRPVVHTPALLGTKCTGTTKYDCGPGWPAYTGWAFASGAYAMGGGTTTGAGGNLEPSLGFGGLILDLKFPSANGKEQNRWSLVNKRQALPVCSTKSKLRPYLSYKSVRFEGVCFSFLIFLFCRLLWLLACRWALMTG